MKKMAKKSRIWLYGAIITLLAISFGYSSFAITKNIKKSLGDSENLKNKVSFLEEKTYELGNASDAIEKEVLGIGYKTSANRSYLNLENDLTVLGATSLATTTLNGLLTLDVQSTDPSGSNGAMYYDSGTGKFRCYQAGTWTNCIGLGGGGGGSGIFTDNGDDSANLTTSTMRLGIGISALSGYKLAIGSGDAATGTLMLQNNSGSSIFYVENSGDVHTSGTIAAAGATSTLQTLDLQNLLVNTGSNHGGAIATNELEFRNTRDGIWQHASNISAATANSTAGAFYFYPLNTLDANDLVFQIDDDGGSFLFQVQYDGDASLQGNFIPNTNNAQDLGTFGVGIQDIGNGFAWRNVMASGTIYGNSLSIDGSTTSTFANGIQLTNGCVLLPDGNCAGTGSSGASIALDNLVAVAINTSLLSDANNTDDLGSYLLSWKDVYVSGTIYASTFDSDTATSTFTAGLSATALNITSTSVTSTFANGIQLTNGCILLPDGNCAGTGGGGASVALDNLVAVAINASLIADADSTYDLGSSAVRWATIYADTIDAATLQINTVSHSNEPLNVGNGTTTSTINGSSTTTLSSGLLIDNNGMIAIGGGSNTSTIVAGAAGLATSTVYSDFIINNLFSGALELQEDNGITNFLNFNVSNAATTGTLQGASIGFDSVNYLRFNALSDGQGLVWGQRMSFVDLNGMATTSLSRPQNGTTSTPFMDIQESTTSGEGTCIPVTGTDGVRYYISFDSSGLLIDTVSCLADGFNATY
jgi:hypothetical protein